MNKFKDVKKSTKFVFLDEADVYKKISASKAKCILGGAEIRVDLEANIFEMENTLRNDIEKENKSGNEIKVVFQDSDDSVICEKIVTSDIAQILSHSEVICIETIPDEPKEQITIGDVGFDLENNTLYLEVTNRSGERF
jgi:hypothetical protein